MEPLTTRTGTSSAATILTPSSSSLLSERTLEECWTTLQRIFMHKSVMHIQNSRDTNSRSSVPNHMDSEVIGNSINVLSENHSTNHLNQIANSAASLPSNEVKPHQCQQCLKSFSSNHQLVQHIRVHTGEKPYKCSYCDRRFKQLSHVQQHTRLHTGERPYKCHLPDCGRAFIQLSNLQQHLRNHDAQVERAKNRPFHCNICGKGFATESSLRTHTSKELQLHLGVLQQHAAFISGPTASCPMCQKFFLTTDSLIEHMKYAHKDVAPETFANVLNKRSIPCGENLAVLNDSKHSLSLPIQQQHVEGTGTDNITSPNMQHFHSHSSLNSSFSLNCSQGSEIVESLGLNSSNVPENNHNISSVHSNENVSMQPGSDLNTAGEQLAVIFSAAAVAAANIAVKRNVSFQHTCRICGKNYINEGSLRKHFLSHSTHLTHNLRMWPCSVCQAVFTQEEGLLAHLNHMKMDPKHQFASQYMFSKPVFDRQPSLKPPSEHPENMSNECMQNSVENCSGGGDINNNSINNSGPSLHQDMEQQQYNSYRQGVENNIYGELREKKYSEQRKPEHDLDIQFGKDLMYKN